MKCKQVQDMMGAYLYGDLAPDEMRDVRQHTQACDACRADLESRGQVIASLPNTAPELSDDDRMRIVWGVKGAVRSAAAAKAGFQFTRGSAAALAGVILAGLAVAALVVVNSGKPPAQHRNSTTIVDIREEPRAAPQKDSLDSQAARPDGASPDSRRNSIAEALDRGARAGIAIGTGRGHLDKPKVVPEKPAAVVEEPKEPEPKQEEPTSAPTESMKLPEPTDANDAKTAQ